MIFQRKILDKKKEDTEEFSNDIRIEDLLNVYKHVAKLYYNMCIQN